MDYEQKYKEALSRARVVNPGTTDYNIVTTIFPELKKSDDERIRENAIQIIRYSMDGTDVALPLSIYKECIAWLEKQGKQSPVEQPSEDFKGEFDDYLVHGDIRNPNFEGPFGYDDIRKTAIHFAQWQKEQLINKACEWLKENIYNRVYKCNDSLGFPTATFLEEFRKAMEE